MEQMIRVLIFDRTDTYLCDLDPNKVLSLTTTEEVNGEHSLTIRTTQELAKTNRVLVCDGMGYWHEYVIVGTDEEHSDLTETVNEYYCVWSLQYDLSATFVNNQYGAGIVPGHASTPVSATQALTVALEGTSRWTVGTVGVTARSSASFYRRSGWDSIKTVLEKWGGEVSATITVSTTGIVSRAVDLLNHVGSSTAARRFDYGSDLTSIKRTISDDVWPCRIVPLGASQETDAGGYTRRPDISSVNGGVIWLQDDAVVPYVRIPDGSGGWEYPTVIIENDTYENPADLKAWALAHISEYTRPQVSYEASVLQLARAGLDPHGVALGDEVVAVDRTFGTDGLRISARVVKMVTNLLDKSDITLTIGNARGTLAGQLGDLSRAVSELAEQVASASQWQSGEDYVSALISRINDEANATGGYTYITEGQGTRTYDVAVSDPLVGAEASMVVEVKGGNIRIANTKDSGGNWEWKTMLQSGYVNSEVIRAMGEGSGGIAEVTSTGFYSYIAQTLYMALTADGMRYYDGTGTTEDDVIALFSAALMRMGYANGSNVEVTQSGITFNNYKGLPVGVIDTSAHVDYVEKNKTLASTALVWTGPVSGKYTARLQLSPLAAFYDDPTPMYDRYIQGMFEGTVGSSDHEQGKFNIYAYDTTVTSTWTSLGTVVNPNITVKAQTVDAKKWELVFTTTTNPTQLRSLTLSVGWFYEQYAPTFVFGTGEASGAYALAQGTKTIASGNNQAVFGKYNIEDSTSQYALIIGNGTSSGNRSNALTVRWNGEVVSANRITMKVESDTATVGAASASIGTNSIRRAGNVVTVTLANIQLASAIANNSYSGTIATIPSAYRPAANVYGVAFAAGANLGGSYFRITTAGVVAIRNQSGSSIAASSSVLLGTTITYVIS